MGEGVRTAGVEYRYTVRTGQTLPRPGSGIRYVTVDGVPVWVVGTEWPDPEVRSGALVTYGAVVGDDGAIEGLDPQDRTVAVGSVARRVRDLRNAIDAGDWDGVRTVLGHLESLF